MQPLLPSQQASISLSGRLIQLIYCLLLANSLHEFSGMGSVPDDQAHLDAGFANMFRNDEQEHEYRSSTHFSPTMRDCEPSTLPPMWSQPAETFQGCCRPGAWLQKCSCQGFTMCGNWLTQAQNTEACRQCYRWPNAPPSVASKSSLNCFKATSACLVQAYLATLPVVHRRLHFVSEAAVYALGTTSGSFTCGCCSWSRAKEPSGHAATLCILQTPAPRVKQVALSTSRARWCPGRTR